VSKWGCSSDPLHLGGLRLVELAVQLGDGRGGFPFQGPVRRIDGEWMVTRELLGTMLSRVGVQVLPTG
jgi:hypothetical protein